VYVRAASTQRRDVRLWCLRATHGDDPRWHALLECWKKAIADLGELIASRTSRRTDAHRRARIAWRVDGDPRSIAALLQKL
jgi:hypothetical protein